MAATCEICRREMVEGGGCAPTITIEGQVYERLRYVSETERSCFTEVGVNRAATPIMGDAFCHDCGAAIGALHHPGCDVERCPRCQSAVDELRLRD